MLKFLMSVDSEFDVYCYTKGFWLLFFRRLLATYVVVLSKKGNLCHIMRLQKNYSVNSELLHDSCCLNLD